MNPDDIKRFEEALKDPKTWPTLEDLNDNRVFRDAASIASAERLIKDHRICLIRGAEGRGKTVLCRLVANEFHGRGWRVWMLDAQSVEAATDASAIASAMSPDGFGTDKTLLVVENAHVGVDDLVPELLALLDSPGVSLLFTARKIFSDREDQITDDPFDSVVAKGCNIDLAPTVATVEEIIKSTLGWHSRLDYALDAEDRAWVAREFGHEMPNLRRLKWYLEYWLNRHDGRLATVTRDRVYGERLVLFYVSVIQGTDLPAAPSENSGGVSIRCAVRWGPRGSGRPSASGKGRFGIWYGRVPNAALLRRRLSGRGARGKEPTGTCEADGGKPPVLSSARRSQLLPAFACLTKDRRHPEVLPRRSL